MITLKRFRALIDSYGGDLRRWPEMERAGMQELLDRSAEARALLEEVRQVDRAIMSAAAHEDTVLWPAGEQDAALARLRLGVAVQIAQKTLVERHAHTSFTLSWLAPLSMRGLGMATGGGFAVAAGLVIGLTYAASPTPVSGTDTVLAMLQPAPIPMLAEFGGGDGSHE